MASVAVLACVMGTAMLCGQEVFPTADPRDFGLIIPDAAPLPGSDRRVVVRTDDGQTVVGKVYLEVGDRFLVLLPNGRIDSVPRAEATLSERPFEPLTRKQIIQELTESTFRGFNARSTNHYVYIYNTSREYFQATSRVLETMYPKLLAYCQRQKINVHAPETPLIVIMFATEGEFRKYRQMPDAIVAYYSSVSNFIVMYEKSDWADFAPAIAVKQSISTIAHEGVHQILMNIGVQPRFTSWPMWISEGLPEYFAPTETGRRVRWAGVGKVNQLQLHTLVEQFKDREITGNGNWIRATVSAQELDSKGYAAAWALTDFLAKSRRKQFYAFLRDVSKQKPLVPLEDGKALFEKHFGDEYAELENDVLDHLEKLPYVDPVANQPHFVAMLETPGLRFVLMTSSPPSIQKWQDRTLNELSPQERARASLNIEAYPNRSAAERIYRSLSGN